MGTHLPDGAAWSSNTVTDFGTGSADGTALDNSMIFSAGITI